MENKELTLAEKKSIEKGILDYIVSVCKKNNIKYFLGYGTLLGAIRHKGFIPWDDDIDLILLRPEYDRLVDCLIKDHDERYQVVYPGLPGYYYPFAKVVDAYTQVEEENLEVNLEMGLWVDLFPFDGMEAPHSSHCKRTKMIYKCLAASLNVTFPADKHGKLFYIPWALCRMVGYHYFLKKVLKSSQKYAVEDCEYVDLLVDPTKNALPKSLFDEVVEVEFEGDYYNAPKEYDRYLTLTYGNYMELPPVDQRVTHGMKAVMRKS